MLNTPDQTEPMLPKPSLRDRFREKRRRFMPRLRAAGRILLILTILGMLLLPGRAEYLVSLWVALNCGYIGISVLWGVFHWRAALWRVRDSALRWSICLSLLSTLIIYTIYYSDFNRMDGVPTAIAGETSLAPVLLLGLSFLVFCLLMAWAGVGAAIGAFAGRHEADGERPARVGIGACMLTYTVTFFATAPFRNTQVVDDILLELLFFSFPLLTRAYLKLTLRSDAPLRQHLRRVNGAAGQRLILRGSVREGKFMGVWPRREATYTLDLRGAVLGLLVAGSLLLLPPPLLGQLKSQALISLTHLRVAVRYQLPFDAAGPLSANDLHLARSREKLIILHIDEAVRYDMFKRSEAAVQADIIKQLQQYGVARIVLPMPYLHSRLYPVWSSQANGPAPNEKDVEHNRRDVKQLAAVLRNSPNLLLALPKGVQSDDSKTQQLLAAAPVHGSLELARAQETYLPIVPAAKWNGLAPVPVLTCAAFTAPAVLRHPERPLERLQDVPGCALPHVYADGVLIDFGGRGPREDFLHIPYSEIRDNAPLLSLVSTPQAAILSPDARQGEWNSASNVLRGRVVFLDSLAHPVEATPIGVMTQSEALAYATATLLSEEPFRRVSPVTFALLTLLLGVYVGHACALREPLDAILRVIPPLFLVLSGTIGMFLAGRWFDPVLPLLTVSVTLALSTQFHFARERADKQRTSEMFGRFVAPHKVQEWLAQSQKELGLGGKRERLCVLFADVRGFTPFAEQHDPTEVIDVINAYITTLTDALHAYDGILDKYTGDGLMAFFQVQQTPTEDIVRAVMTALAMRDAALALSRQRKLEHRPTLNIGLSLHYGEAVVGLVGNIRQQINYTALGLTVVVAARLQTIARGGDVIVSEEVFRETQHAFVFEVGEPVQVKGLSAPVHPYRVLAPQARVSTAIK